MPRQPVLRAGPGPCCAHRHRDRRIRAHVRASLLLGHEHADHGPGLFRRGNIAAVVDGGQDARHPFRLDRGRRAQGGHHGTGHGHRAHHPALGLAEQVGQDGLAHVARFAFVVPGEVVHLAGDGELHQVVIGGVVLHRVDTHSVAVEGAQLGTVAVGLIGLLERLVAPGQPPHPRQMVHVPGGAHGRGPGAQRLVVDPQVLVPQVRRHVDDLVGRKTGDRVARVHWRHLLADERLRSGRLRYATET